MNTAFCLPGEAKMVKKIAVNGEESAVATQLAMSRCLIFEHPIMSLLEGSS